jgi:hypothetical protein
LAVGWSGWPLLLPRFGPWQEEQTVAAMLGDKPARRAVRLFGAPV